ncbi:MAG TPA: hypothetical protein DIS98_15515 [Colwellia sp.]|nr:hypothetical protein [Colwellia sp.]|tara:strand:+ start:8811 stop:9146 length:336 start_codon:yes stop_codon:yes gene_type:complete
MNNMILCNLLVSLFLILTTNSALADTQQRNIYSKSINAKCYVVLASGNESILLYRLKAKKLKSLPQRVNGSKVATSKSNKKVSVLKVHECVVDEDEFSSARAKSLDKNFAR